ncbi:hypothetical protein D3C75_1289200 [compost metagenome]
MFPSARRTNVRPEAHALDTNVRDPFCHRRSAELGGLHRILLHVIESIPPRLEFVRVFNVPFHTNIPPAEYNLKGITV